eukprot:scaffold9316_cov157-Isochrysis_galbana.AAC.3
MRDRSQAERPAAAMAKCVRTSTHSTGQTAGTRPCGCVQIWRANSRLADLAPCPRFYLRSHRPCYAQLATPLQLLLLRSRPNPGHG